jgi:hypothetical protein
MKERTMGGNGFSAVLVALGVLLCGCSRDPGAAARDAGADTPKEVATLRVNCNPGLRLGKDVPEVAAAFDKVPAGKSLVLVLVGDFGDFWDGNTATYNLNGGMTIEAGHVDAICKNGTVVYQNGGKVTLDWRTRQLEVVEYPVNEATGLSFALDKDYGWADFAWITLPDGSDVPDADRSDLFFLPARGAGEFTVELRKSYDFKAGPSRFSISRSL